MSLLRLATVVRTLLRPGRKLSHLYRKLMKRDGFATVDNEGSEEPRAGAPSPRADVSCTSSAVVERSFARRFIARPSAALETDSCTCAQRTATMDPPKCRQATTAFTGSYPDHFLKNYCTALSTPMPRQMRAYTCRLIVN